MAVSLNDNVLTTLSTVKDELGITGTGSDDYLKRQINHLSDLFIEATGREYHRVDGHTESVKSHGDTRLMSKRRPVLAINSIDIDGTTVDSANYEIEDAEKGYIRLKDDFWESTGVAIVKVRQYTQYYEILADLDIDAGYVTPEQVSQGTFSTRTLPGNIEHAVISAVATKYRRKGAPAGIDSEQIGDASISYAQPTSSGGMVQGVSVSPAFEAAVRRYRDYAHMATG